MFLDVGTKVLMCHRRLFPEDQSRFFVGSVCAFENGIIKVEGTTWTRDVAHGFHKKRDLRTKIVSLHSGTMIIYELPSEVDLESLRLDQPAGTEILLTDDGKFSMDLSERVV